MNATRYITVFKSTCEFHNDDDTVCGQPAVGVYVRADDTHRAVLICQPHADESETGGDGPVFYLKPDLTLLEKAASDLVLDAVWVIPTIVQDGNVSRLATREAGLWAGRVKALFTRARTNTWLPEER